jgi:hypothetical protein
MVLGGLVTTDTNPIHPRIKIPGSYVGIGGVYNPTNGFALDVSGITHILGNLDVSGNAYAYTFTTTSDYRIKENPTPLDDTYIVDKLNPLTYRNKLTGKTDIGLIAHELQDEYPCLVFGEKDAEEYQRVNYSGLIPILIKEVKELKQRVKTLEEERNHV